MDRSKHTKQWPQDYKDWSGDFNDLVKTTGEVMAQINPGAKPPSSSLIRHYQQIGCVGRGDKLGRASKFGFHELFQAVACKDLANNGVNLGLTSKLLNSPDAGSINQMYSSPQADKNSAMLLVERLAQQSRSDGNNLAGNTLICGMGASLSVARTASAPVAAASFSAHLNPILTRRIQPCAGVDVYLSVDESDPDAMTRAANALRAVADSLSTPKPRKP